MKTFKQYNESQQIKTKDLQETIDEVLDSLSDKGKLSDSENEFMIAASNDEIRHVTTPHLTGDFMDDVTNPHNIGIMWQGDDGVWKQLEELSPKLTVNIKDKDYKHLNRIEDADDLNWEINKIKERKKILKENPGLKQDLEKLAKMFYKTELETTPSINKVASNMLKKWKKNDYKYSYDYNQIIGYAFNGTSNSLINQFGYWPIEETGHEFLIYEELTK